MRSNFFIEEEFNSLLKAKKLNNLKLFQINDGYFESPTNKYLIIDGGVELSIKNETYSIAWNTGLNAFVFGKKTFSEIYEGHNYLELNYCRIEGLNEIMKHNIIQANCKWGEFNKLSDCSTKVKTETRLIELNIEFESIGTLKIATVDYKLDENITPNSYTYATNGELLITMNDEIEISVM